MKSAELFVSLGRDGFITSKKVQDLFNSSDKRVLENIYNDFFMKIHDSCESLAPKPFLDLTDSEVDDILRQLDFNSKGLFQSRTDLYQYIQTTFIHAINGREIIARRLLEGFSFVFPNPHILNDFSDLGIVSFGTYSEGTKRLLEEELNRLQILSSDVEIGGILDLLTKAQLTCADLFGFTTTSVDNRGTDLIQKIDRKRALETVRSTCRISEDAKRIAVDYLENIDWRRIQIFEFKVSGRRPYDVISQFIDAEMRGLDMGGNFLGRNFADYRNLIDQLNTMISAKGNDGLFFDSKIVGDLFDFGNFFSDEDIMAQRAKFHGFLKSGQFVQMLDDLKGSKLHELMEDPNLWNDEIREYLVDFIDVKLYLNDVATIEEFLFSGKIMHVNYVSNQIEALSSISFDVRLPDGSNGILELESFVHTDIDGEIMLGFDVFKDGLKLDPATNPFIFTNEELRKIVHEIIGEVTYYLNAIDERRIYSNFLPENERQRLEEFIFRHSTEDLDYYFSKDTDNEFRFLKELPVTVVNYIKQKLQQRLFKNQKIGLVSQLDGLPYGVVKGISGTGHHGFFRGTSQLLDFRYMLSTTYDELAFSSRRALGLDLLKKAEKSSEFLQFLPLINDLNKARLGYDGKRWIINSEGMIAAFDNVNGKKFVLGTINEWIETLKNNCLEEFAEQVQSGNYVLNKVSPYNYRNPSRIQEIVVSDAKIMIEGKGMNADGIFPELSRPVQDVDPVTRLDQITELWVNDPVTSSSVYWKSALQTLTENGYIFSEADRIRIYNEMIYLADQRAKIGTFLTPILEILDEKSKADLFQIAKDHAETVSEVLKNCPKNHYACNMVYSFTGRGRSTSKDFSIVSGKNLPPDFKFIVNENNVMAWYIDKIVRDKNFNGIPLKFEDTPENRQIVQALTLKKIDSNIFSIRDVVLGTRHLFSWIETEILVNSQKGIIRYFAMLERRARVQSFENMQMARIALKDFLKTKRGNNLPFNNVDDFIDQAPIIVLPPNTVRSPSGIDIPTYRSIRDNSINEFIPITLHQETFKRYLAFIGQDHLFNKYKMIVEKVNEFVVDIDKYVFEISNNLLQQMEKTMIEKHLNYIVSEISKIKSKNLGRSPTIIKLILKMLKSIGIL